jgi:uroporphyrinogen decarboxylase
MGKPDFDRILKVLMLEEPDRIPLFELYVDLEVVEALTGNPIVNLDFSREGHRSLYIDMVKKFFIGLGYDYIPMEVSVNFPPLKRRVAKDVAALSGARGSVRSWMNETEGVIKTTSDLEMLPDPSDPKAVDYTLLKELCKNLPDGVKVICGVGPGGLFEISSWLMGLQPFLISLYKDEKLISRLFDRVGEIYLEFYRYVAEFDHVGALSLGDDLGYKKGTMMSPRHIHKYVLPWYKKFVEVAHKHGKPFILHSCGNLEAIMNDLIEIRVDGKHSYQEPFASVKEAKEKYGDRMAILGGVDVDKLTRLPPDELKSYVLGIIQSCAPGGGYALGSGNSITNYMNLENYMHMIRICRKYGEYPYR